MATRLDVGSGMTSPAVLSRPGLDAWVTALIGDGYWVIGPTVQDSAIVLAPLTSGAQLPAGWSVDSAPGQYRLRRRTDAAVFAHSAGPQSWKQFLHPSRQPLWTMDGDDYRSATPAQVEPMALLGVRPCDLAAIAVLGRALGRGTNADTSFVRRRARLLIIAAGCTEPGGVCFCASMGTGPEPGPGFDLALTERIDEAGHRFVVEVGTEEGARVLDLVTSRAATQSEITDAEDAVAAARSRMGRRMPDVDLRALLADNRDAAVWQEVADRCLTCGNCTMVCPTCFCTTPEDITDLTGEHAERWQRWASCFELDFSYLHGGSVRKSAASRYRHWISHKLSTWYDHFGQSGCVGCGRCIAWCPVGIDITEEAARLAGSTHPDTTPAAGSS
jgi:ferredoxin